MSCLVSLFSKAETIEAGQKKAKAAKHYKGGSVP
jgi:hypothetical protein